MGNPLTQILVLIQSGVKFVATPLMQYLSPVGGGPSGNTCPRCDPHRAQCTSVRTMPQDRSVVVSTDPGTGSLKLGQPVPLSNFLFDSKRG